MAKRFTATEKWGKEWFQDLSPRLKCLWLFICDNADAAGVWEPNYRLASFQIGESITQADLVAFGDRLMPLSSGKVAVVSFIPFQYGKLSDDCKAHIPIFRALSKHRVSIGYAKGIHTLKEEEEDKERDKEEDKKGVQGETASGRMTAEMQIITEAWNATTLPSVRLPLGESRKKHFRARLSELGWSKDALACIAKIAESDFCQGRNDNGWRATFDWLLQPDTLAKVMEGKYDNRGKAPKIDQGTYALKPEEEPEVWNPLTDETTTTAANG